MSAIQDSGSGPEGTGAVVRDARHILWMLTLVVLLAIGGTVQASFRLFDDFEDEIPGPIGGQDDWMSAGGDNRVVLDPANAGNQVLYVPSESSILRKSLLVEDVGVPNGTVRMMFMRIRVSNKQTFSVGLSGMSYPREFSDFATEIGMANSSQNLDLRAWDEGDGNYEVLAQLTPDHWYNMWVLVNAFQNDFQIWLNDVPGAGAAASDKLSAPDGDETFDFRTGRNSDLFSFFIKTAGGGSGTNFGPVYFDDIHIELVNSLNLTNPTAPGTTAEVLGLTVDEDKETLTWDPLVWATGYDVVKGDLVVLRDAAGEFATSVISCLEDGGENTSAQDGEWPVEGYGFFYLVRGIAASEEPGTYDSGGTGQTESRDEGIEVSSAACP